MFSVIAGTALYYLFALEAFEVKDKPPGTIHYNTPVDSRFVSRSYVAERPVQVSPLVEQQFRGLVRQAYDYSCGSAALTTVLNGYLGRQFTEKQVMDGLLKFGETEKIVQRRGFSLLDMKRLVTALGHPSGGYRGSFSDLKKLDHPAIVPIHYGGFKHFVVVKKYQDGRVFVADPALGNMSFPEARFEEIWDNNVMFIVFPNGFKPQSQLELTENDMRYVDDQTITLAAFREAAPFLNRSEQVADRAATMNRVTDSDENSSTFGEPINVPLRTYFKRK